MSAGSSFATLHAVWQARQPTQSVESNSIPTALGLRLDLLPGLGVAGEGGRGARGGRALQQIPS